MSIADVSRAYVPTAQFGYSSFVQKSLANIQAFNDSTNGTYPNRILPVKVSPTLVHRKVWAYLISISGTYSTDCDLVATLNGSEVFRQKIVVQNSASVNQKFYFGIAIQSSTVGAQREQLITTVANTTTFGIAPHYLNINCDEFHLAVNALTGAAANWDGGVLVQSQAGI
jgi:hypothetical protein